MSIETRASLTANSQEWFTPLLKVVTGLAHFVRYPLPDLHAEVWSCQFSPGDSNLVATTSEDQTCKIWLIKPHSTEFTLIKEIAKHDLAVTCVDWQLMHPELGNVVACCSDDKRIRAFRFTPGSMQFEKIVDFSFSFVPEFFTLTYMALEQGGRLLAVASQIGHLFVFDLLAQKLVFHEKIHLGGIEGLAMHKGIVYTCSSDNTAILSRVKPGFLSAPSPSEDSNQSEIISKPEETKESPEGSMQEKL